MKATVNKTYFALLEDIVISTSDDCDQKDWLYEEYRITEEDFEELICGYITSDRIVIYKSSEYLSLPEYLMIEAMDKIAAFVMDKEGIGEYKVWNGMVKDEKDNTWQPRIISGEVSLGAHHSVLFI